jgi:hypothetical protein
MRHKFKKLENHLMWKGGRVNSHGYTAIKKDHPRSTPTGYVLEHIVIAEEVLGKPLSAGVVIHHVNGDGHDNRKENLVICENDTYHRLLHKRSKSFKITGNVNYRKCWICQTYGDPKEMMQTEGKCLHWQCVRDYSKKTYHIRKENKRIALEVE